MQVNQIRLSLQRAESDFMPSGYRPSIPIYVKRVGLAPSGATYAHLAASPFSNFTFPRRKCVFIHPSIFKESNITFKPYTPPNEGTGLLSVDRDLCWRINPRGLVTPAVIGAICWARNNFDISDSQHQAILEGIGLEYRRLPAGATILQPQLPYRLPLPLTRTPAEFFNLTAPQQPLDQYDAVEVYPCVEDEDGIERFEVVEYPASAHPHFWSVALHLEVGHIETIADFPIWAHAEAFADLMRQVLLSARKAAGLTTTHL